MGRRGWKNAWLDWIAGVVAVMAVGVAPVQAQGAGERLRVPCYHHPAVYAHYFAKERTPIKAGTFSTTKQGQKSGITFNLIYEDVGLNVGFGDPVRGAQRRAIVDQVINYLDGLLNHPGGRIDILFKASRTTGDGFLAFATPLYPFQAGFAPGAGYEHIVNGTDILPGLADVEITFDFGYPWNDTLAAPAFNQFDLFTVSLHELVHGLGFISLTNETGQSTVFPGVFSTFDRRLHTVSPFERLWNDAGQIRSVAALSGGPGSVVFVGDEARTTLGFNPFIFAQDDWEENNFQLGVTLSHWQLDPPNPSPALMQPIFFSGVSIRSLLPFEVAALRDLGYNTGSPSPTAWMMH